MGWSCCCYTNTLSCKVLVWKVGKHRNGLLTSFRTELCATRFSSVLRDGHCHMVPRGTPHLSLGSQVNYFCLWSWRPPWPSSPHGPHALMSALSVHTSWLLWLIHRSGLVCQPSSGDLILFCTSKAHLAGIKSISTSLELNWSLFSSYTLTLSCSALLGNSVK